MIFIRISSFTVLRQRAMFPDMLRRAEGFSDILGAQVAEPRCPDRVRKSGDVE